MTTRSVTSVAIAACLAGCSFDRAGISGGGGDDTPAIDAAEPPDLDAADPGIDGAPPTGRFRKGLTIPGGTVDANLSDFPLYVELTDPDLTAHASDGGGELHFVGANGSTELDHEIQAWDRDAGHLEAWVRVPSLSAGNSTTIYVRYGAFASSPPEDPAGVWSRDFVAVWHLEDDPQGTAGDIADSLGPTDATSVSMSSSNRTVGAVGRGLAFGDDLEQLTFANPLDGSSAHTISAWVDQDTVAHNSALVVLGNGVCGQARWLHTRFTGGAVATGFYCDDWTDTAVDVQADGWTLVHWTYAANGTSRLYVDGALAAGPFDHAGTQSTVGTAGFIGNAPAPFGVPMNFEGGIDEVRLADVVRTPEWIAAEHANQSNPATFYVVGAEEPLP
jgi:hypothetical protein